MKVYLMNIDYLREIEVLYEKLGIKEKSSHAKNYEEIRTKIVISI